MAYFYMDVLLDDLPLLKCSDLPRNESKGYQRNIDHVAEKGKVAGSAGQAIM